MVIKCHNYVNLKKKKKRIRRFEEDEKQNVNFYEVSFKF